MKKILIMCLALVSICNSVSANDKNLYITPNSGEVVVWKVASLQKMMFQNGNMILVMKDGTSTYTPIASVQKMNIRAEGETNSIDGVSAECELTWDGTVLHVSGTQVNAVSVYGINGMLVMQSAVASDGSVNLDGLQSGVYIVNVGGAKVKIVK